MYLNRITFIKIWYKQNFPETQLKVVNNYYLSMRELHVNILQVDIFK